MGEKVIELGTAELANEKVWFSDPMYARNVNELPNLCYNTSISNAKKGKWVGFVIKENFELFGIRNGRLLAIHTEHADNIDLKNFQNHHQITVDSGLAGIFSDKWMNESDKMALLTDETEVAFSDGFISQSGMGDWVYQTRIIEENGKVIAIELDFQPLSKEDLEVGKEDLVG